MAAAAPARPAARGRGRRGAARRSRRLWRFCGAAGLLRAQAARSDAEATNCFYVLSGDAEFLPADFFEDVRRWADSGAPRTARGGGLDILAQPIQFVTNMNPEEMPLPCLCDMMGISMSNLILRGKGDEPWPLFVGRPWEDIARSPWPILELVAVWAEAQLPGPQEIDHFWRTCPSDQAFQLWRTREVEGAGHALWATLHAGPAVIAGVARMAAVALLSHADVSAWPYEDSLCGILPWALVAHALAMSQERDSLVTPGYAIRLFQTIIQHGFVKDRSVMLDVVSAPWPVMSLVAQLAAADRARCPNLDTVELTSGDPSGVAPLPPAFAHIDSGRARQLMDTMHVAHDFLVALGARYIAIAGTLLGAVRHMQRIPWDDDIDLCVDALNEARLFGLVLAQEARRLGLQMPRGLTWRARRALRYLEREGYVLKVEATRSLVFRVVRAGPGGGGDDAASYVDLWRCWGLDDEDGEVTLMSWKYGPTVPRAAVLPRRKLPFGDLAVWGPADPAEVTRLYLIHAGMSGDFMSTCEGQKVHGVGNAEYADKVPCESLGSFAGPWQPLGPGPELDEALGALRGLFEARLPGLVPPPASELGVEVASLGPGLAPRLRARGSVGTAGGQRLWCEALLWCSEAAEEDLLHPGASPNNKQVVRSLTCGEPLAEPSYVWEDAWL